MNPMQRPLFRQAGGPIMPPQGMPPQGMPPQGMPPVPPPEPIDPMSQIDPNIVSGLEMVEQESTARGEEAGQDFVAESLRGIEDAEDFEDFINSIRGNAKPLSERRSELSQYVGPEDANQTPDSVLALVQPTLMLSEEGAMDSGIGELMQRTISDVEMATEDGQPTELGEGIGSLMIAQQSEEPMGMQYGGAVQHYANGMGVSNDPMEVMFGMEGSVPKSGMDLSEILNVRTAKERMPEYLEMYRDALTTPEDAKDRERQRGLALAQAGFQLASGQNQKGQSVAGQPFLSQLAGALGTYGSGVGESLAAQSKEDRALRLAALNQAISSESTDRATRTALIAEARKLQSQKNLAKYREDIKPGPKPEVRVVSLGEGKGSKLQAIEFVQNESGDYQPKIMNFDSAAEADAAGVMFDKLNGAEIVNNFGEFGADLRAGKLSPQNEDKLLQGIQAYYEASIDPKGGGLQAPKGEMIADIALTLKDNDDLFNRLNRATRLLVDQSLVGQSLVGQTPISRPDSGAAEPDQVLGFLDEKEDLSDVFGGIVPLKRAASSAWETTQDVLDVAGSNPRRAEKEKALRSLSNQIKGLTRQDIVGRLFASQVEEINDNADKIVPSFGLQEKDAFTAFKVLKRNLEIIKQKQTALIQTQEAKKSRGEAYDQKTIDDSNRILSELELILPDLTRGVKAFPRFSDFTEESATNSPLIPSLSSMNSRNTTGPVNIEQLPGITIGTP
jgi:hypothetical protein